MRRIKRLRRLPRSISLLGMHHNHSLPIMIMSRRHKQKDGTIFLVIQIIHHSYFVLSTSTPGVVDREVGRLLTFGYTGLPSVAPDVGVLTLGGGDGLELWEVDIWGQEGALEGPGWVGGGLFEGFGEEEDAKRSETVDCDY